MFPDWCRQAFSWIDYSRADGRAREANGGNRADAIRFHLIICAHASRPQAINHGVLAETNIAGQAVGYGKIELPVGGEHRGIGAAGGREFFGYRQLPLSPPIDARSQIGLRLSRRSMNEIDFDEIESLCRLGHRKLAGARPPQRLMRYELAGVPTIKKGFAGEVGKGEPGVAIRAKKFVGAAALRRKFLERRERPAVPTHQTGGTGVIRVSKEVLTVDVEINPVIAPPSVQGLKVGELGSIPFKNTRAAGVPRHCAVDRHPLGEREKVAITDGKIVPLLSCKGWKRLEGFPAITGAPVENGVGIEFIRSSARSNAGRREKFVAADPEEERVLPAGDRQPP